MPSGSGADNMSFSKDVKKEIRDRLSKKSEDFTISQNADSIEPLSSLTEVFLQKGSVNDPGSSYHLEIVCDTESEAAGVEALMRDHGFNARNTRRKGKYVVYLKDRENIADFLGTVGAVGAMMEMENSLILKDMRNSLNRKVNDVDVAIYREDSFDESLFKIPKNESSDFYRRRRDKIRSAQIETNAAPVPKSVKDDYNSKATDALAEIAIMISLHNRSLSNESGYVELEKANFTPKTILLLKNEIEKSTTPPPGVQRERLSVNVPFLSIARAVVLKYELEVAVKSCDRTAALDACENFAESAEFNPDSARLLAQQLEIYAQSKTDLARDIINVTLTKAEVSTGHLGNYLRQIMKAQSEIEAE